MITWQQFFEAKEKEDVEEKEEELGQDLDGDNEEGESEGHKKKVGWKPSKGADGSKTFGYCKSCCKSKKQCKC